MLFTVFILLVFRLGAAIPVPFINVELLKTAFEAYSGTLLGYFNILSGGALSQATLFALTISPYINASIIIQLLTVAIPALERMAKDDGEEGRKKLGKITRYATVVIAIMLGLTYYTMMRSQGLLLRTDLWSAVVIITTLVAGSSVVMWLGDQVTEKGVGNGISIILFAGIISRVPQMIVSCVTLFSNKSISWFELLMLIVLAVGIVLFIVFMDNAERKIPIQYAKRVVGRKQYGGQSTHLPVKVSMSGVMPIIFASSIISLPGTIALFVPPKQGSIWAAITNSLQQTHPVYIILYMLFIIAFAYFYTAIQFNPIEISNNLKKNGGFIPGFRPGKPTTDFIARVLNRITLIGALFLGVISLFPLLLGFSVVRVKAENFRTLAIWMVVIGGLMLISAVWNRRAVKTKIGGFICSALAALAIAAGGVLVLTGVIDTASFAYVVTIIGAVILLTAIGCERSGTIGTFGEMFYGSIGLAMIITGVLRNYMTINLPEAVLIAGTIAIIVALACKLTGKFDLVDCVVMVTVGVMCLFAGWQTSISSLAIGGTSVIIVVGVAIETVKQIESMMLMRHYKGFLE